MRLKPILRVGGILLAMLGLMFLGTTFSQAEDTPSAFLDIARMGGFSRVGLLLLAVGATAIVASLVVPGQTDD